MGRGHVSFREREQGDKGYPGQGEGRAEADGEAGHKRPGVRTRPRSSRTAPVPERPYLLTPRPLTQLFLPILFFLPNSRLCPRLRGERTFFHVAITVSQTLFPSFSLGNPASGPCECLGHLGYICAFGAMGYGLGGCVGD